MKALLKTEFFTHDGNSGIIITRKRTDGLFVTTFTPSLGLNFHSIDANLKSSHETVKNFIRDIKGCRIKGESRKVISKIPIKKRFIL